MSTYLDLVYIALIWAFIIDYARAVDGIAPLLARMLRVKAVDTAKLRPFSCSLCMTWWTGLAYIIVVGQVSLLNIGAVCIAAALTLPLGYALRLVIGIVAAIISRIQRWVDKIY